MSSSPTDTSLVEPAAEAPEVPREIRLALFRLVLLQRLVEERIINLYRQGRIPGSVYTGRGQEAVAAAAGLALGPDDVVAPVNREMACHFARGVEVAHVLRNYLGRAHRPDPRSRRQHALRLARAQHLPARLDARLAHPGHRRAPRSRSSAAASRGSR